MVSPPKRSAREFLDTPGQNRLELEGLLGDIRRTNSRFGGYPLVLGYLRRFLPRLPPGPITVLDVATASADVPRAIASWARAQDLPIRIVALDLSADILALAASGSAFYPEVRLLRGNALALPFPDGAFDVVICGLALHHFTFEDAGRVLREIDRVARCGFIVNDIGRSWGAYLGALLDTRLFTRNHLARHDGPLSVLRAFTVSEVRAMVAAAGLQNVEIRRHPWFRIAIVRWPVGPSGAGARRVSTARAVASVRE
ncbi:MAG TPA: methyltransferase domain-containing protein [bacterium]|nr:methyltransferase domain-containing protein [bacterium]